MLEIKQYSTLKVLTYSLVSLISIFYILYIGSNLIIPFIIAIFISLMLIWLSNWLKKIKVPASLSMILAIIIFIIFFYIVWSIINTNIQWVLEKLPYYQTAITNKFNIVLSVLNMEGKTSLPEILQWVNLQEVVKTWIDKIMVIFKNMWIIIFFILFILLEYKYLDTKLEKILNNTKRKKQINKILNNIKSNLSSYFIIKTIISFITATLSYIVMLSFNLDFAIFWAFLVFSLNFIPSIWSIISVSFPITLSLVQFDTFLPIVLLSVILIIIQVLMWNIIEPRFMWNRLNLSPLAIIIALSFWGTLWWIVWMILSVPLMIILNISLAQIPSTRKFSILISEKWDIQIHE